VLVCLSPPPKGARHEVENTFSTKGHTKITNHNSLWWPRWARSLERVHLTRSRPCAREFCGQVLTCVDQPNGVVSASFLGVGPRSSFNLFVFCVDPHCAAPKILRIFFTVTQQAQVLLARVSHRARDAQLRVQAHRSCPGRSISDSSSFLRGIVICVVEEGAPHTHVGSWQESDSNKQAFSSFHSGGVLCWLCVPSLSAPVGGDGTAQPTRAAENVFQHT
jgi:hypothetical protein